MTKPLLVDDIKAVVNDTLRRIRVQTLQDFAEWCERLHDAHIRGDEETVIKMILGRFG